MQRDGTIFDLLRLNYRWRGEAVRRHRRAVAPIRSSETLEEFPPRQKPASFGVGNVVEKLEQRREALAAASK
jgi:hypothetical protein